MVLQQLVAERVKDVIAAMTICPAGTWDPGPVYPGVRIRVLVPVGGFAVGSCSPI